MRAPKNTTKVFEIREAKVFESTEKNKRDRFLAIKDQVICKCDGMTRTIRNCLLETLELGKGGKNEFQGLVYDVGDFPEVFQCQRSCAMNGINRIIKYCKPNSE